MLTRRFLVTLVFTALVTPAVRAQQPMTSPPEALMEKMTGHWVMTGTIANKPTTHEVDAAWVLKREYIRIHEVSRDKDAGGGPVYEAWIYLVWDAKNSEYALMWLDNTAATNFAAEGVGHAKADGDRMPFNFKDAGVQTTFAYDRASDTWSWTIDNVGKSGKRSPFANLTLRRK